MRRTFFNAFCAVGLAILTQGCAGIPYQTYDLVDDIAEDQASLNDAYGRALNGQILLNVLRSRDRWPRHYTNVSAITDQPTIQTSGGLSLTPLGLGSAASPLTGSGLELGHEELTRPSYGVEPLDSEGINRAVLSPTNRSTFAHYWNSGWPRDVLLLVMVSSLSRSDVQRPSEQQINQAREGARRRLSWGPTIYNDASDLLNCRSAPYTGVDDRASWQPDPAADRDCAFYEVVQLLASYSAAEHRDRIRLRANDDPECVTSRAIALNGNQADLIGSIASLSDVDGNDLTVRLRDSNPADSRARRADGRPPLARRTIELANCPAESATPVILEVLGPTPAAVTSTARRRGATPPERPVIATYYLQLRSLDEMVYAMGEQLRGDQVEASERTGGRSRVVRTNGNLQLVYGACSASPCRPTSLFRVFEESDDRDQDFSAMVVYRGQRYFAGPPADEIRANRRGEVLPDERGDPVRYEDRTATVLTLLTQIFALNNSPGALASIPARPVLD